MRKPITKKVVLERRVNVYPMYQKTSYEFSSDLMEKHIIKRLNRNENIIPDNWKLNEEDFNRFMKKYDYGDEIRFDVGEIDVDYEEFGYMDEEFEIYDDDEQSLNEKFYMFLFGKGSVDEKTNTYLNIKREMDRKEHEEWNKKVKEYQEVQ